MLCPHCRHNDGLHSAPSIDGRADDGGPLSPAYIAGQCGQATRRADGSWEPCPCPGWYPHTTRAELDAATARARIASPVADVAAEFMRAELEAGAIADLPFSLTAPIGKAAGKQERLF